MPRMGIKPIATKRPSDCAQSLSGHRMHFVTLTLFVLMVSPVVCSIEFQANLLSNYSFRGISQTKGSPSYHIGATVFPLDPLPIYLSADLYRVYQIDEQERSKHAINYQLGLEKSLTDKIAADMGVTWYTYRGYGKVGPYPKSQERNYPEWYLGFLYEQTTSLYLHYTDDALGSTNARNLAFELRHLTPSWVDVEFYVGRVTSLEKDKLRWDDDKRYLYFGLMLGRVVGHWSASLTFEGTSLNGRVVPAMKDRGERKVIAQFGYRWSAQSE